MARSGKRELVEWSCTLACGVELGCRYREEYIFLRGKGALAAVSGIPEAKVELLLIDNVLS